MAWTNTGPLSLQSGIAVKEAAGSLTAKLQVIDTEGNPSTAGISHATAKALGGGASVLLQLAAGSDCVVLARAAPDVPDGAIALSQVQQYNFRIKTGPAEFRVFQPPEPGQPFELVALEAEVSLLGAAEEDGAEVDAAALAQQLARSYFGCVLAASQAIVLEQGGQELLLRVAAVDTLSPEEQEEALGYHCFRGLLTPNTQIYLTEVAGPVASGSSSGGSSSSSDEESGGAQQGSGPGRDLAEAGADAAAAAAAAGPRGSGGSRAGGPQSALAGRTRVRLVNARRRDTAALSRNTLRVTTADGEWFPVRRRLLRRCIALTKAVRDEGVSEAAVDVDTLTFDRVLIFLEAEALSQPAPSFGVHFIPPLLEAAQKLGLRSLEEYCQKRLGDLESRLRWFSADEIRQRNGKGECLLVLDGMVLDVTRWLPEHPGGSTIIPRQSLNIDCARFFELYHHSRESFLYLQEFYLGEVLPEDRGELPRKEPSPDFLQQLREYTHWRLQPEATHTHLGSKR